MNEVHKTVIVSSGVDEHRKANTDAAARLCTSAHMHVRWIHMLVNSETEKGNEGRSKKTIK